MTIGPPDVPPPRKQRFWMGRRNALLVFVLFPVMLFGSIFVTAFVAAWLFLPRLGEGARRGPRRTSCVRSLKQLGGYLYSDALERGGAYPSEGGAHVFLQLRRNGSIPFSHESVFKCSFDPDVVPGHNIADSPLFDTTDLRDPEFLSARCSYATRDFATYPVTVDDTDAWIACDRQGADGRTPHHPNGLHVLFADGHVEFLHYLDLGLERDEPIIVGPDSPHPELRKMIFLPANEDGAPSETTPR